ncbi:MAG TPA: protease inhibitor I42 family protein [Dehalococcoidia bacterium]|nr:protease inhibitor I42 family protein [Dehalococcoidia bacterium]
MMVCLGLASALLLASCEKEARIYSDTSEPIVTKVGGEFVIALDFDLIHLWRESYDETMLSLVEHRFGDSPQSGEAGIAQHFRFRALKEGETEVVLTKLDMDGKTVLKQVAFQVRIE